MNWNSKDIEKARKRLLKYISKQADGEQHWLWVHDKGVTPDGYARKLRAYL